MAVNFKREDVNLFGELNKDLCDSGFSFVLPKDDEKKEKDNIKKKEKNNKKKK